MKTASIVSCISIMLIGYIAIAKSNYNATDETQIRYGCCDVSVICNGKKDTCTGDIPCIGSGSCTGKGETTLTYYHDKQTCISGEKEGTCGNPQGYTGLETYKCKCSWGSCQHRDQSFEACPGEENYTPGCGI